MLRRALFLLLPLLIVAALEAAYRAGAWEIAAAPKSHAGETIRMKALWAAYPEPIDVVTLGSSRAVYGLDHAALAAEAQRRGVRHASFALAGSHWMSVRGISRWIEAHRPEVRKRWIALSIADFQFAGNGAYELGIVEPLRSWSDAAWIGEHVRFDSHDVATYGVYSSLMQYRGDMADAITHPTSRLRDLAASRRSPSTRLFDGPHDDTNACAVDTSTLERCMAAPETEATRMVRGQCRSAHASRLGERNLLAAGPGGSAHPDLVAARDMIVRELRRPRWRGNTVVILLPTHALWERELTVQGLHGWVEAMLRPLAEEGSIELLDYTQRFDRDGRSDCTAYLDLYHQNHASAALLTRELLDAAGDRLYAFQAAKASGMPPR